MPGWLQVAIVKARRIGDHAGADNLRRRACEEVDRIEAAEAGRAAEAYARTQAMMGERPDDGEPGE